MTYFNSLLTVVLVLAIAKTLTEERNGCQMILEYVGSHPSAARLSAVPPECRIEGIHYGNTND